MRKPFTLEESKLLWDTYYSFRENKALENLYNTKQHRTSNTYRHVCLVAKLCAEHVERRKLHYDFESLMRGAFLHDYFFYDWRKDKLNRKKHLREHPERALANAKKDFHLTDTEIDIIKNHMWPLTITKFPKTKEGRLVMMEDKKATMIEFFSKKKELIVFDMDGTILNTLGDLQNAVNYALKKHNFPERDYEQIRKAVGNGVAMLVKRSVPEDTDDDTYKAVLKDFEDYYKEHSSDLTAPYEGVKESLIALRRRGYQLAVATNKIESVAKELTDRFYPNLFQTVCGDDGKRAKKPAADDINEIQRRLKVRNKHRIIYIGDSEVDYQTAVNSKVNCILVTYGYRTKDELKEKGINKVEYIDHPKQLEKIFYPKFK